MDIPTFVNLLEENASTLTCSEEKAFNRHTELTELSAKMKFSYSKQDDETIKEMMRILESENKEYKEISRREKNARSKLISANRLIKYLQPFHDSELFEMKVNLSSPKGLKNFMRKAQNHSALLNQKVQGELKKAEQELLSEQRKLEDLEKHSLMAKLCSLLKVAGKGEIKHAAHLKAIHRPGLTPEKK